MKSIKRAAAIAVAALAVCLVPATAAQAGTGACSLGYACLWTDLSYEGTFRGWSQSRISWGGGYWLEDEATSVAANGRNCHRAVYWDGADWNGNYFYLNSQTLDRKNYRDPDLRNGAGYGPLGAQNANDLISSANWADCA